MSPEHHALLPSADPWTTHMRRGEWEQAWRISDGVLAARRGIRCDHLPRHQQYVWDGTPLAGRRVLVRCYHGLGDTLQFIRFAPLLGEIGCHVTVWAQPVLLPLLGSARGIDRLLPLHDGTCDAEWEVDLEVMELPHALRTIPATLPARVPYLHAEPAPIRRGAGSLAVGVVWQAGDWDSRRSVPLREVVARLGRIDGVTLHALQRGPALAEWTRGMGPVSGSDAPEETASAMCALDLVVSVDSMPAHLAGALGVPVWTLLHAEPDWRWPESGEHTPWYPTMRLLRQPRAGDWAAVLDRAAAELRARVAGRVGPATALAG